MSAPPALEEAAGPPVTAPEHVIALQRTAGNRAVTAMLARWDDPPSAAAEPVAELGPSAAGVPDIGPRVAPERRFEVDIPPLPEPLLTDLPADAALPADWRRRRANRYGRIPLPALGEGEFEGIDAIRRFALELAALTARRRGTAAGAEFTRLVADYRDYVEGARARFGGEWQARMNARIRQAERDTSRRRRGEPPPTPESIEAAVVAARTEQYHWAIRRFQHVRRGWMIGRREQLDFDTLMTGRAAGLGNLRPEEGEVERVPIEPYGTGQPIHPALRDLLHVLHGNARETAGAEGVRPAIDRTFRANNYSLGHGSGHVGGLGLSVDLTLVNTPLDDRGFWRFEDAVALLMRVHAAATALGGKWIVLYNDFAVANEINARTSGRHVMFVGTTPHQRPARRGDPPGRATGLNWHGPEVLHFHLDFTPVARGAGPAPAPAR